jgi:hydroxypyruvate isomerase
MMKFAANLGFLFTKETPNLLDRFGHASKAGFLGVEVPNPYDFSVSQVADTKKSADLEVVLLNSWPGRLVDGELGIAIFPDRKDEFITKLESSIEYARALNCNRLHILAGKINSNTCQADMEKCYMENLRYAANRLEKEGVVALIEPINNRSVPGYFLNHPRLAVKLIEEINHPNLRLQYDIFHAQILEGDLTRSIKEYFPHIGHIQVAQVPDRGEPNSPGEINYDYVFKLLDTLGYNGWIGLEYVPSTSDTVSSLTWLQDSGRIKTLT